MTHTERDIKYMRRALQLARLGASFVSPNPMVGAVVVCGDKIIGEGYHRRFGYGHAEVNALGSVGDRHQLPDSTVYVTLEPCSHYGKTPPCAKLLIGAGVKRVVVGCLDPNPKVSGRGVAMLCDAGIEVEVGVLEADCKALNKRFITAHTFHRPHVLLKWAQTDDGAIGYRDNAGNAHPIAISNGYTRMLMHRERSLCDAILVGAGTIHADKPSLTVRDWQCRANPLRVIIDPNTSLSCSQLSCMNDSPTLVYVWHKPENSALLINVEFVEIPQHTDLLDFVLNDLYLRGISSVMVEGGACTLQNFISEKLYDEIRVEVAHVDVNRDDCANIIKAPEIKDVLLNARYCHGNIIFNFCSAIS